MEVWTESVCVDQPILNCMSHQNGCLENEKNKILGLGEIAQQLRAANSHAEN